MGGSKGAARDSRTNSRHRLTGGRTLNDRETTVRELIDLMAAFVEDRDWQPFHDPKNLSASIAIEAAELMEHFQWMRTDELPAVRDDPELMSEVRDELADILAYVVSFAGTMGIDLAAALEQKMKKNAIKYPAEKFKGKYR